MDKNIFSVANNTRTIDDFKARLVQGGAADEGDDGDR